MDMTNQDPKEKTITIEAELCLPFSILLKILQKTRNECDIIRLLQEIPEEICHWTLEWMKEPVRRSKTRIELRKLKYLANTYDNFTTAVVTFQAELEGMEKELRKIAGPGKLFRYDWQNQNPKQEQITIEAELPIALSELAIYTLAKKGESEEKILTVLDENPVKANRAMKKIANEIILENKAKVQVKKIRFDYMDSARMWHGVAYFKAELKGKENDLRKIAGEDKLFFYQWKN